MTISLYSSENDSPHYEQDIDLCDLQFIGDELTKMQSFYFPIVIFKVPSFGVTSKAYEYYVSKKDFNALNEKKILMEMSADILSKRDSRVVKVVDKQKVLDQVVEFNVKRA